MEKVTVFRKFNVTEKQEQIEKRRTSNSDSAHPVESEISLRILVTGIFFFWAVLLSDEYGIREQTNTHLWTDASEGKRAEIKHTIQKPQKIMRTLQKTHTFRESEIIGAPPLTNAYPSN